MRLIKRAIFSIILCAAPLTAHAGPAFEFKPKKPTPTSSPAPKLGPVCSGTRCVLGPVDGFKVRGCSAVGKDSECYVLGCTSGTCSRISTDNPNLQAGRIPSCSEEGAPCGKTYCEMGGPGVGYVCRYNSDPAAGAKECTNASDCYGSKCVGTANGLELTCQEDKNSLTRNCTVGTPEGCMEKRCIRSASQGGAKVCTWVMPGVFTDDKENPRCDVVGTLCAPPSPNPSTTAAK